MAQKKIVTAFCLLSLATFLAPEANAQSFLEKLEKTVREQLQQPAKPDAGSEELPAPKAERTNKGVTPPVIGQPASPVTPQAGTAMPVPSLSRQQPTASDNASGAIYLGIEVEEPIGTGIGVRIASVEDKSPAFKGDMRVGDRILAINGFAIANIDNMVTELAKTRPGETVRFLLSRSGRNLERRAVLMDAELAARIQNNQPVARGKAWLGVEVNDLTDSFRRRFGLGVYSGAAIVSVTPGSPSAKAGFKPGEVIADVNGTPIESASTLTRWIKSARPGERAEFLVYKGGKSRIVEIVLEADPSLARDASQLPSSVTASIPSNPPIGPAPLANSNSPAFAPGPLATAPSGPVAGETAVVEPGVGYGPLEMRPSLPSEGEFTDSNNAPPTNPAAAPSELERLRTENAGLRAELAETKDKLNKLQSRVDTILKQLQLDQNN